MLSTFTDVVIVNNWHMMDMLAISREKDDIRILVDEMDEYGFRQLVDGMAQETSRFIEATSMAAS